MRHLILIFISAFIPVSFLAAQPGNRTVDNAIITLVVSGKTVVVDDLTTTDSLAENGQILSRGEFALAAKSDKEFKELMSIFISNSSAETDRTGPGVPAGLQLVFTRSNLQTHAAEDREYKNASITYILLSALDATQREKLQFRIRFQSAELSVKNYESRITHRFGVTKAIIGSNFRIRLGDLPERRISGIGPLELHRTLEKKTFNIEISRTDAAAWTEQLLKNSTSGKTIEGEITLLGLDMKDELMKFTLTEIMVVKLVDEGAPLRVKFSLRGIVELNAGF